MVVTLLIAGLAQNPLVGAYRLPTTSTTTVSIEIQPQNRIRYASYGCFGGWESKGEYRLVGDAIAVSWQNPRGLPSVYAVVRWDKATLLVATERMDDFAARFAHGVQKASPPLPFPYWFTTSTEPTEKGAPVLPKRWARH